MGVFVGLDRGSGAHAVCVIDDKGTVLERFEVPVTAALDAE